MVPSDILSRYAILAFEPELVVPPAVGALSEGREITEAESTVPSPGRYACAMTVGAPVGGDLPG